MPDMQAAEVLQFVADHILPVQQHEDGKGAELHERVDQDVDQRGGHTALGARHNADQHIAGVRDRRVREHALQVGLRERRDVPDGHRHDRHYLEQQPPVRREGGRGLEENPQQHRERAAFDPLRETR